MHTPRAAPGPRGHFSLPARTHTAMVNLTERAAHVREALEQVLSLWMASALNNGHRECRPAPRASPAGARARPARRAHSPRARPKVLARFEFSRRFCRRRPRPPQWTSPPSWS